MNSTSPKLDSLPVEILQRIASYGPCESALALLRVSRTLQTACNNRHVFKTILINRNGFGGSSWQSIPLSAESPTSSWARYALADSKAAQWQTNQPLYGNGDSESLEQQNHQTINGTDLGQRVFRWGPQLIASSRKVINRLRDQSNRVSDLNRIFLCWAPQLMASSRKEPTKQSVFEGPADPSIAIDPMVDYTDPWSLFTVFQAIESDDSEETYASALCLTLRLLSPNLADVMSPQLSLSPSLQTVWTNARAQLTKNLNTRLDGAAEMTATSFYGDQERPIRKQRIRAIVNVGILAILLREAIERGAFNSQRRGPGYAHRVSLIVPTAHDIAFDSLPLPFSPDVPGVLANSHLEQMTDPKFFEEGEWEGVYTYSLGARQSVSFDDPMRGMRFQANRNGMGTLNSVSIRAKGWDGVADFDLEGMVERASGKAVMVKRYANNGPAWGWDCVVTPFGIVGTWGQSSWGGWIWLWKVRVSGGER